MNRWFFLLLILTGCTPQVVARPPVNIGNALVKHLVFHVGYDFQGDASMRLEEAVWRLDRDTRGKLKIELRYDFDYVQNFSPYDWYLANLPIESELTKHFDEKHGATILGECDYDHKIVYMMTERLASHDRFVHVAMHEFLHAAGLQHVKGDPHAIMAAIVVSKLPIQMAPADIDMFCATLGCPTKELRTP